jgi:hypothetical protein
MAISLAFYTLLTALTAEQELIAHRRRGTDRRYRQQGCEERGDRPHFANRQQQWSLSLLVLSLLVLLW